MEAFRQPEYVHVLINHLPLTGLFAVLLGLVGSLAFRKRSAAMLSMGLVSVFSLSVWPVYVYGEAGYDRVYSMADSDGGAYLSHHKRLAEHWIWVFYVTSATGALGAIAGWKWPKCLWAASSATALFATASLVAAAVIADAGGKVRHREFRHGPPPAMNDQSTTSVGAPRSRLVGTQPLNIACLRKAIVLAPKLPLRC